MTSRLKLTDILVTIVIAIVFGIIYKLWGPLYGVFATFGLHVEQLTYGMWFIAAVIAYLLIRKPGVALLAEVAAASGEFLTGSQAGMEVLVYGFVQGLCAELIFFAFRYKRFDVMVACLAGLGSAAGSILLDVFKGYIIDLEPWNLALYIGFRSISAILITGVFAYLLVKALEATGVTNLVRPISQQDYDALDG